MDKDILLIDKGGRPPFEFTPKVLKQIEDLASYMCTKDEVANIIGCSRQTLWRNKEASDSYDKGVNVAKLNIRKTQFDIATKLNSSIMAMWLGKVYLGQTDKIQNTDDNTPLPIYDIIEEPQEIIELKEVQNDTIPKQEI
jgi:DNA-binding XRE family transcriptional regulator